MTTATRLTAAATLAAALALVPGLARAHDDDDHDRDHDRDRAGSYQPRHVETFRDRQLERGIVRGDEPWRQDRWRWEQAREHQRHERIEALRCRLDDLERDRADAYARGGPPWRLARFDDWYFSQREALLRELDWLTGRAPGRWAVR